MKCESESLWTACADALPDEDGVYIVYVERGGGAWQISSAIYCTQEGGWGKCANGIVMHWQPWPDPPKRQLRPGQLWYDRDGHISNTNPTTYLLLSTDARHIEYGSLWKVVRFCSFMDGGKRTFLGGSSMEQYETDILTLEYVGDLSTRHLKETPNG